MNNKQGKFAPKANKGKVELKQQQIWKPVEKTKKGGDATYLEKTTLNIKAGASSSTPLNSTATVNVATPIGEAGAHSTASFPKKVEAVVETELAGL